MKFAVLQTTDPYLNLAIEEYLFRTEESEVFLLWQNRPTVVIGKNQNAYAEVALDVLRERDILLARRITGGGAVYHDLGNINYTYIAKSAGQGIDFARFTAPIIKALSTLGIRATLSGRNDLLVGERKFSGNAQHSANGKTLHHGTLLFDSDLSVLAAVLRPDEEKLRTKAVRSVRSRVTNIAPLLPKECQTGEFLALLAECIRAEYAPDMLQVPQNAEIERLRARNASPEWLFPKRDMLAGYQLVKKERYPFGGVEIALEMLGDVIRSATVRGDFFSTAPIEELEALLCGKTLADLPALLAKKDVSRYIHGMSASQLCELLQKQ